MGDEDERRVMLSPELQDISDNVDTLLTRVAAVAPTAVELAALATKVDTLLTRLSSARAGYLDQLDFSLAEAIAAIPTTAMRGTDGAALASSWTAALATALGNYSAVRAGYLDNLAFNAPSMVWAGSTAKVVVPGTGADLDFPSVVIAGIPDGVTLKRVDAVLVVGFTLDSSTAENQIKAGTTDAIHVLASGGSWANCISAIPVPALSYETPASGYGGGGPIFGNTDIKATVTGNGTWLFRSEETSKTKAIEATGGNLELHVVSIVVRAWW